MNLIKFKNDIEFALKNKYNILVHYTDEIDYENNEIKWKFPPYIVKNCFADKIINDPVKYLLSPRLERRIPSFNILVFFRHRLRIYVISTQ